MPGAAAPPAGVVPWPGSAFAELVTPAEGFEGGEPSGVGERTGGDEAGLCAAFCGTAGSTGTVAGVSAGVAATVSPAELADVLVGDDEWQPSRNTRTPILPIMPVFRTGVDLTQVTVRTDAATRLGL
jgi:hypothetical protein